MRIALYQPDIPQNTGTILRLGACLGLAIDVIGPAGFDLSERALRRAGLDYLEYAELTRHADWDSFEQWRQARGDRLVLLTTKAQQSYLDHAFSSADIVMLGRESAGVPETVHSAADARVCIPMREGMRSLNVAVATAMVAGEAMRQLRADGS